MPKTPETYWDSLRSENQRRWKRVAHRERAVEEVRLAMAHAPGDYSRPRRFRAVADVVVGSKSHHYPKEVMIIEGRLYDAAFDRWLAAGDYASRLTGEIRAPVQDGQQLRRLGNVSSQSGYRQRQRDVAHRADEQTAVGTRAGLDSSNG